MVSYDENATDDYELSVYLDGVLSGYSSELGGSLQVKLTDEWLLGVAAKNAQTNGRFTGLLDDMRFYNNLDTVQDNLEAFNRALYEFASVDPNRILITYHLPITDIDFANNPISDII